MKKDVAGNNQFLKKFNKEMILDLIRTKGSISKIALAQLTGLSPTAIGSIVTKLIEEGYIHERGTGQSRGGRRPKLLELKPGYFYSIGIDIDVDYVITTLVDITGNVIHEISCSCMNNSNPTEVFEYVEKEIIKILTDFKIDKSKLLGIGISIPGLVDDLTNEIILAPNLSWENISMDSYFKEFSTVPIYIENEAMASAVCEHWVGQCQGIDDFICINIKSGIGAGIFTSGKLYRGKGGSAGEIGHTLICENGPRCGCGNYGCLEAVASTKSIVESAKKIVKQGSITLMNDLEDIDTISISQIIKVAREGDEAARNIILESARYLSLAISNLVNTLNPAKIVIGKEFTKYADMVMESIITIVSGKALKYPASKVEIVTSQIGERASAVGAALIPLKVLFGK